MPRSSTPVADGKNARRFHALALGLSLFLIYAWGASRTIYVGDSGELVAAVHTLGIPHPSGYPLYVLLGKLWTVLVPVGSIALRMSLFSAFCAAAAVACFYLLGRRLSLAAVPALFSSLVLAFSPSFWSQANIQRVYSLNALFLVLSLTLAVAWYQTRQPRDLVAAFFVAALGATNHTYMGVFAIALGMFALIAEPGLLRKPRTLIAAGVAFVLGLSPYLYLPIRSRANPRLDWGNPETIRSTLDVILRRDAWERAWLESPADLLTAAGDLLLRIGTELFWLGAILAVVGILWSRKRNWPILLLLLAILGNYLAMALHGSRSDLFIWYRYYIPTFVIFALLAGLGLELVSERIASRLTAAALLLPLTMLVVGYPKFDRSDYRIADDFSRTLLSTLPPGAHLSATDDNILFVLIYLQLVERVRPDIDLILQGVGEAHLPPLRFDPDADPLYFTHHPNWEIPELEIVGTGLAFRIRRRGSGVPEPIIPKARARRRDGSIRSKGLPDAEPDRSFPLHAGCDLRAPELAQGRGSVRQSSAVSPGQRRAVLQPGPDLPPKRASGPRPSLLRALRRHQSPTYRLAQSGTGGRPNRRAGDRAREGASPRRPSSPSPSPCEDSTRPQSSSTRRWQQSCFSRGEPLAARGHALRALEAESHRSGTEWRAPV